MLDFLRKKKREKPPTPKWLIWVMLGVLAYALLANQQKGSNVNRAVERASHNAEQTAGRQFSSFKDVKVKLLPSVVATLRITDTKLGDGQPAVCGQDVEISYESSLGENAPFTDKASAEHPLRFTIGHNKVMPAFERGVIGMKRGGRRTILAPYDMSYGAEGFANADIPVGTTMKFDAELLKISPPLPDLSASAYRIIDSLPNTGNMVLCGAPVKAHVTLWDAGGKKLFSTHEEGKSPLLFTPGKSEVFLGLEQGVIGMSERAQRIIIVPPEFQKTMRGNAPKIEFPLPKGQAAIVEVEVVP